MSMAFVHFACALFEERLRKLNFVKPSHAPAYVCHHLVGGSVSGEADDLETAFRVKNRLYGALFLFREHERSDKEDIIEPARSVAQPGYSV